MNIIDIKNRLSELPWVKNKAEATSDFWDMWRSNKDDIKSLGISVKLLKSGWYVYKQQSLQNIVYNFNPDGLYDYQIKVAQNLLNSIQTYHSAIDASGTGTGKTFSSLAVARSLNIRPLVLAPKSSLVQWKRIANEHFAIDIDVVTYEKVRMGNTDWLDRKTYRGNNIFEWNDEIRMIIFDEAHKLKNAKSLNSKMALAAQKAGIIVLFLSASIADSIKDISTVGKILGLFTNFYNWSLDYGKYLDQFGRIQYRDSRADLLKLHYIIFPKHGQRILQTDPNVRKHFPDNRILPTLYTLEGVQETINKLYKDIRDADTRIHNLKNEITDEIHPLTIKLRARQELERIKAPILIEQAKESVEEGNSAIVFVNFLETLHYVSEKLKCPAIYGEISSEERADIIDRFQKDELHTVVIQSAAGGESISLHDAYHGNRMRTTFISPVYSGRMLLQILGRAWRAGGLTPVMQHIVYIADTEEEDVYVKMLKKIHNIQTIQDGEKADLILDDDVHVN